MSTSSVIALPYNKVFAFGMLLKPRLSLLVVFSAVITYITVTPQIKPLSVLGLSLGGFLITGAANAINQIMERSTDRLMDRTRNRPLPLQVIAPGAAVIFSIIIVFLGLAGLWFFTGMLPAILGLISVVLYAFVYTPLKLHSPLSVLVGAFPGALPTLIGGFSGSSSVSQYQLSILLFLIQFFWQFPHFWSLAWFNNDDYLRAGFHLLPSRGGKNTASCFQILLYSAFLLPLSVLPFAFGAVGLLSTSVVILCGIAVLLQAYTFYRLKTDAQAKKLFFITLIYLPLVQLALMTRL